ncbi:MAG: hypothetical protein ACRD04_12365 [Terriglobales bacterium]
MYFHWAALWGWIWDGVVIALMTYWTRHDDRDGHQYEDEESWVTPREEWHGRPLHR